MPRIPSTLCLSQLGQPWKKYYIFNGLNNRSLLSHNSEGWKSEIMVPSWSSLVGFCESCVPACKWPPSCCVFVCYFHGTHTGKNKRSLSLSSYSHKTTNSIMRALPSQPHLTLVTLLPLYIQIPSHWLWKLQIWFVGDEHRHSVYNILKGWLWLVDLKKHEFEVLIKSQQLIWEIYSFLPRK